MTTEVDQPVQLATFLRTWESLAAKATKAGLQFGGRRDVYQVAGYPRRITFDDYLSRYERDGIARRIVAMPAKTTWRMPPEIVEPTKPDGTTFTKAFASLAQRSDLNLWRTFETADTLSGIGEFGIVLIGTRGVAADGGLRLPLQRLVGPQDVLWLAPHHQGCLEIERYVKNPSDPQYGLPEVYKLKLEGEKNLAATQLLVHASRVLHIAEDAWNRIHGTPRLQPVFNLLIDLEKISASTGEGHWQQVVPIHQFHISPEADISADGMKELEEKAPELVHDLRRYFIGQGVELKRLSSDTPSVKDLPAFFFSLLAASVGIPQRKLFGSERGELASSLDEATYLGTIAERQRQHAEPNILRAFIDRMVEFGALPRPETGQYEVVWPALFEESENEIAEANLRTAQAAQALTPVGGDPVTLVEVTEDRRVFLAPRAAATPTPFPEPPLPEPMDDEPEPAE